MGLNNPTFLRAIAAVLTAVAVILNGKIDAQSIGDAIIAFIAVLTLIQAAVAAHDNNNHA